MYRVHACTRVETGARRRGRRLQSTTIRATRKRRRDAKGSGGWAVSRERNTEVPRVGVPDTGLALKALHHRPWRITAARKPQVAGYLQLALPPGFF